MEFSPVRASCIISGMEITDILTHPLFLSGGLILTWISVFAGLLKVLWFDPRREGREEVEDKARIDQINAERFQNVKEAEAAEATSATQLLKVVDYMIGLIDRLDQRVQKDISLSIEELRRLIVTRVNVIDEKVDALSRRVDIIDSRISHYHGGKDDEEGSGTKS